MRNASDKYTIEHILPEHPDESWTSFSDEQVDRCVFRIGNMTPLEATRNREVGNQSYPEKRAVFEQSGFQITRRGASEHLEWTPDRVAFRQQWLASQATAVWRLAELSLAG
ncbi:MAG: HNH endonuclease family protein [Thermodesulfobacteriota bacterium]